MNPEPDSRSPHPDVLGLDIGGANLKAATAAGRAVSVPFALWKQPDALPAALAALVAEFPDTGELAVTMTGELCDCYATKREGVNRILDAVEFAASDSHFFRSRERTRPVAYARGSEKNADPERRRPVRVWGTGGNWLSVPEARERTLEAAASNWHALATFAGRFAPGGAGLLIDIGSTTTDIIPMRDGVPVPQGRTDFDRLRTGELVYVGVMRTPLMALGLPGVCAEYFADMRDVHIVLRAMPEECTVTDTADGRPATRRNSLARLARMIAMDSDTATTQDIREFARRCVARFLRLVGEGIEKIAPSELQTLIVSGTGESPACAAFRKVHPRLAPRVVSLADELGPEVSACAPAYAVAVLATEARP